MISKDYYMVWWLGGLAIFAISIMIHAPLAIEAVPGGILDHQAAANAAAVFFFTDFTETLLQVFQLLRLEGSDTQAFIASAMGPAKVASFLASVGVIVIALIWDRLAKGASA